MDINLRKLQEIMKDRKVWLAAVHGVTESDITEQVNNNRFNAISIKILTNFFHRNRK